jgi:hypothetical protein
MKHLATFIIVGVLFGVFFTPAVFCGHKARKTCKIHTYVRKDGKKLRFNDRDIQRNRAWLPKMLDENKKSQERKQEDQKNKK